MAGDCTFGEIHKRVAAQQPTPASHIDSDLRQRLRDVRRFAARLVDSTLEDSFPASDPPSWNSSVARPGPSEVVPTRKPSSDSCEARGRYSEGPL